MTIKELKDFNKMNYNQKMAFLKSKNIRTGVYSAGMTLSNIMHDEVSVIYFDNALKVKNKKFFIEYMKGTFLQISKKEFKKIYWYSSSIAFFESKDYIVCTHI